MIPVESFLSPEPYDDCGIIDDYWECDTIIECSEDLYVSDQNDCISLTRLQSVNIQVQGLSQVYLHIA